MGQSRTGISKILKTHFRTANFPPYFFSHFDGIFSRFLCDFFFSLSPSKSDSWRTYFSLFTFAGCGLLVFISFAAGAGLLKLMNTYYPDVGP